MRGVDRGGKSVTKLLIAFDRGVEYPMVEKPDNRNRYGRPIDSKGLPAMVQHARAVSGASIAPFHSR